MKTLLILAVIALAGCANLDTHQYATATGITVHEPYPGKYVFTERDTAWTFGPTLGQRAAFNANHSK